MSKAPDNTANAEAAPKVRERNEIATEDKWNVESLYPSLEQWDKEFETLKGRLTRRGEKDAPNRPPSHADRLLALKGTLRDHGADAVCQVLELNVDLSRELEKLYTWAHLKHDEDTVHDAHKAALGKITQLHVDFSEMMAWFEPELLALPKEQINEILASPKIAPYRFNIERLVAMKDHTLTPEMEEMMAIASPVLQTPGKVFSAMNNSDLDFGTVKDGKGNDLPLSHGTYSVYIRSQDRTLRENAFKALHKQFRSFENTLCETINGTVQKHVFVSKARHYQSCLEAALKPNNIPTSVYRSLVATVRDNLPALHKYVRLRKKLLGYDELHLYDMYVPLMEKVDIKKSYDEAEKLTIQAVAPLGTEYQSILKNGLINERWVDRYENKGKRSGAYSSGCYDSRPYILMNFVGELHDVFTLTHEAGHSMHSYFSRKTQPFWYADYSIFVAEVASTFNEQLLRHHLLATTTSKEERIFLINQAIEDIRATLFRQTMFAEFELRIHELAESKTPLTPKLLREMYRDLNRDYFGDAAVIDEDIEIEWARIPHFHYNFYVYQYATGISAALCLSERVLKGGEKEREDYLSFLKAGSSAFPVDVLKRAGVDMAVADPIKTAIDVFANFVDELEKLMA